MTQKAERAKSLLKLIPRDWQPPAPLEGATLLEQGLLCVLTRHLTPKSAETCLKNLRQGFPDWNELRVAQVQEIVPHVPNKRNGAGLIVARAIKEYLQEVFQKNHGFDLEFLREDLNSAVKVLSGFPYLGAAASHYLVWFADEEELPVSPGLVRTLDRLGLIGRTTSMKKARAAIEPLVPKGSTLDFSVAFGLVVERWCDAKKPTCWECPLVVECPHGKKVARDWKVQQERLEAQRLREQARAAAQRKKEEARERREEERRRKEAERRAKKLERERARQRAAAEKKRALEEKKKEAEKKRAAALAKKKAAQKKSAAKKAAKKKAAKKAKKSPKAKTTKKKATTSRKKTSSKRPASRKPVSKKKKSKPAPKKPSSRKKTTSKKTTRKPATKKKTTSRKSTTRKKR